jgi:UDP-N-acetylglucosamine 2-epimerase (non-hydrolysing)
MSLVFDALLVITDSGGVQEETTYLEVPCLTLRRNTERPITIHQGTNELVNLANLSSAVNRILSGQWKRARPVEFWDGQTALRVVESLEHWRRKNLLGSGQPTPNRDSLS